MNYDSDYGTQWSKNDADWSNIGTSWPDSTGAQRSASADDAWDRWQSRQPSAGGYESTSGYVPAGGYGSSWNSGYEGTGSQSGYREDDSREESSSYRRSRRDRQGRSDGSRTSRSSRSGRSGSRSSSRRNRDGGHAARQRRRGVPVLVFLLAIVISAALGAGASAYYTRNSLLPQIEEAQTESSKVKSQVSTLTNELTRVAGELDQRTEELNKLQKDTSSESNTSGVDDPWVDSGKFTSGNTVLDGEVKAYCDSIADTSMDRNTAVFEVYKSIAWSDYVERDAAQQPSGKDWRIQFARMYYENDCSGNCYEFASFLSYCMQYLGFSDATAQGVLVELQSGGWGDHGVVYVTSAEGEACICDTARGTDGWMLSADTYNVQLQDFENA